MGKSGFLSLHGRSHVWAAFKGKFLPWFQNECGKGFHNNDYLKDHLKTHAGIRDFLCDFCGKGFKRYNHWKVHMKRHKNEKMHACDSCDKTFVTNGELARWVFVLSGFESRPSNSMRGCVRPSVGRSVMLSLSGLQGVSFGRVSGLVLVSVWFCFTFSRFEMSIVFPIPYSWAAAP